MKIETIRLAPDYEDAVLTAILQEDSQEFSHGRKRPAVIVCPGGGYCYCSDREAEPVALRFAGQGYQAFILRYTTAGQDHSKTLVYETALRELGRAILTIRERAEEWFVDPDKLVLCGFSAGGHLAGSYSTHWRELAEPLNAEPEALRPNGAMLVYAVLDYEETERFHAARNSGMLTGDCNVAIFGTASPTVEQQKALSPCNYVTKDTPPTLLVHAADDFLVPCENSLHYAAALVREDVPCELHLMESGSHGFSTADAASATFVGETNADTARWTDLAISWLRRHAPLTVRTDSDFAPPSRRDGMLPPPPPGAQG